MPAAGLLRAGCAVILQRVHGLSVTHADPRDGNVPDVTADPDGPSG